MSSSAIQVAKTATYLPDLVEVRWASFKWFLEKGLIEELESFSPDHRLHREARASFRRK